MSQIPEKGRIVKISVSPTLFHPNQKGGSMFKIPELSFNGCMAGQQSQQRLLVLFSKTSVIFENRLHFYIQGFP